MGESETLVSQYRFTALDRLSLCVHFLAWGLVALVSPRGALEAMLASAEEARRLEALHTIARAYNKY